MDEIYVTKEELSESIKHTVNELLKENDENESEIGQKAGKFLGGTVNKVKNFGDKIKKGWNEFRQSLKDTKDNRQYVNKDRYVKSIIIGSKNPQSGTSIMVPGRSWGLVGASKTYPEITENEIPKRQFEVRDTPGKDAMTISLTNKSVPAKVNNIVMKPGTPVPINKGSVIKIGKFTFICKALKVNSSNKKKKKATPKNIAPKTPEMADTPEVKDNIRSRGNNNPQQEFGPENDTQETITSRGGNDDFQGSAEGRGNKINKENLLNLIKNYKLPYKNNDLDNVVDWLNYLKNNPNNIGGILHDYDSLYMEGKNISIDGSSKIRLTEEKYSQLVLNTLSSLYK